jgi:hypothetical protein
MICSTHWEGEIREAVTDELEAPRRRALRAHLAACAGCRTAYDSSSDAVAALERNPGGLPEAVTQGLAVDLFAQLEAEGALAPSADRPPAPVLAFPARRRLFAGLAAAGLLAAGLVITLARPATAPAEARPEFAPRGGAGADVGFSLFCIGVDGAAARIESTAIAGTGHAARCRLNDRIQFTYSLQSSTDRPTPTSLALFAQGPQGQIAWYWPRADGALALEAGARQAPLPGSFDLSVRHAPGRWRVFGVFGARPLSRASLEAHLGQGSAASLRELETTEGFAILEAFMEIVEAPGGPAP